MGLFVTEDGRYQGWLAALLCCCAAVNEDEAPFERERDRTKEGKTDATQSNVYYQQPMPLTTLPTTTHPAHQALPEAGAHVTLDDADISVCTDTTTPTPSERNASLATIDSGAAFIPSPRHVHNRRSSSADSSKRSRSRQVLVHRASDHAMDKRQTLVPMRLGPVVLRDARTAFGEDAHSWSTSNGLTQVRLDPVTDTSGSRPTPFLSDPNNCHLGEERLTEPNSAFHAMHVGPTTYEEYAVARNRDRRTSSRASMSDRPCPSHVRKHSSTSSLGTKHSFERTRPGRMRSFPALRRQNEDVETQLDNEILELNTIVEERRTEANRSSQIGKHIPAIAPSMEIRARSETLDAIGSALSRPKIARGTTSFDTCTRATSPASISYNIGRNRSRTWVSGWLSDMLPTLSSPSSTFSPSFPTSTDDSFYKPQVSIHAREVSYDSSNRSALVPASPTLTAISSPTTTTRNGHSRSQTGESQTLSLATAYSFTSDERTARYTVGCRSGLNTLYDSGVGTTPVAGQVGVAI